MLYDERAVREGLRNREGKRVFYLAEGDKLTPSARDFLARERIEILPPQLAKPQRYQLPDGSYLEEKPEYMTHLNREYLVRKDHPRIRFRGAVDSLESELLLCGQAAPQWRKELEEALTLARKLIACDVLGEPMQLSTLGGLTPEQLRSHSHFPQEHYGQPHFMPEFADSAALLQLNRCRCAVRETELAAVAAFCPQDAPPRREDILQALNRLSSLLYILMIKEKTNAKC